MRGRKRGKIRPFIFIDHLFYKKSGLKRQASGGDGHDQIHQQGEHG